MRLGVDVGGTNTDAVVIDGRVVLGKAKSPTTQPSVAGGITESVNQAIRSAGIKANEINAAMIGTTQVTNAIAERRRLLQTAVVRVCLPANTSLQPMVDWPQALVEEIGTHFFSVRGGVEVDGSEHAPFDGAALREAAIRIRRDRLRDIAVVGLFSPVDSTSEKLAADIINDEIPEARVTLSSDLGFLGFVERENAAILNASLGGIAQEIVQGFASSLSKAGVNAPVFVSQNNGSLMTAEFARRYPILMAQSGPTNSMRGAAWLTGMDDAVVIDVGGTTTDIGMLANGRPHERALPSDTSGVRTNFRMPDILSLALGGGSIVSLERTPVLVGPRSVHRHIETEALIFGGDTPTATDVAVGMGRINLGDRNNLSRLTPERLREADQFIRHMISDGIDQMKLSADPVTAIVVGGGARMVPDDVEGIGAIEIPEHADVANAIGAATAPVSGEIDLVLSYTGATRSDAITKARERASERAVAAGANPETLELVEVNEIPLSYTSADTFRVRIIVAGELAAA